MLPKLSRYALILLAIAVMSVYLPRLYHKVFDEKTGKTQLFFSPVIKKFIFREMVGEGHQFVTRDETGKDYDRQTFETLMPFIYYKNMDLWGKLPLHIDGHVFDKETMKKNRQVFELKPHMIADRSPRIQVFPLLESQPGRTRLRFPEDAFRMTDRMEFINVDTNTVDKRLTEQFTGALKKAGFVFPARLVAGRVSILKSFDEGFFVVDANGSVYHVKRAKGQPVVIKTPIPSDLAVRNIKVTENKKREIYGTLLTEGGELYLITYDNYRLIKLPLENYNPNTMDFKLLINPLCRTAVYSDDHTIYAVAMDTRYRPIAQYQRVMFSGRRTLTDRIYEAIFPFYIKTTDKTSGYLRFDVIWNGRMTFIGIAFSLLFAIVVMYKRKLDRRKHWPDFAIIMFTGLYGLISVAIVRPEP
jgi:hypothetical protein